MVLALKQSGEPFDLGRCGPRPHDYSSGYAELTTCHPATSAPFHKIVDGLQESQGRNRRA